MPRCELKGHVCTSLRPMPNHWWDCQAGHCGVGHITIIRNSRGISDKVVFDDGAIQEIVVWRVPSPVAPSEHAFKYRLYYGFPGRRLVSYDNERGKGDHRHAEGREEPYSFRGWEALIDDFFLADVAKLRGTR